MGTDCPKCKGTLVFYDGAFEHNPKWVCNRCGYETEDPSEHIQKKIRRIK